MLVDRARERARRDDREVVLQIDLIDLGWHEWGEHGGGRPRALRHQCPADAAGATVDGDAEPVGLQPAAAQSSKQGLATRRVEPTDEVDERRAPARVGALGEHRNELAWQGREPGGGERAPAFGERSAAPRIAEFGGARHAALVIDEPGEHSQVGESRHLVERAAGRGGEAFQVG